MLSSQVVTGCVLSHACSLCRCWL